MAGLDLQIKITGVSDFQSHLGTRASREKALNNALKRAARIIQRRATELAPVRTGTLRRSMFTQELDPLTVAIRPGVNYGTFVEFGTKFMEAQPFLFPAAEDTAAQVNEVLASVSVEITAAVGGS